MTKKVLIRSELEILIEILSILDREGPLLEEEIEQKLCDRDYLIYDTERKR